MPLRDHFRPPVWNQASWEGFHAMWPVTMVQQLFPKLPAQFVAEPRVHLGTKFEIDICGEGTTATLAPPHPTRVSEVEPTEEYTYEVLIFDTNRGRELVAAVEIVSPANKDRPESRQDFVTKCAALLQNRICVSIVDLVTTRHFNLYGEVMILAGDPDVAFTTQNPATYAVTCRGRKVHSKPRLEVWAYPLVVGQPLPRLPIWLTEDQFVWLDLEPSYEDACRTLRIR